MHAFRSAVEAGDLDAVAALLFGDVSPAGRLPFTWPRHVGQVPMTYSHYRTFAPQEQGERYWDEPSTPLYPFGHGLSYTTFGYSDASASLDEGGDITVDALVAAGAVRKNELVKVLGTGEISAAYTVTVDKVSESAKAKIEAAGGSVTVK